MVIKFC